MAGKISGRRDRGRQREMALKSGRGGIYIYIVVIKCYGEVCFVCFSLFVCIINSFAMFDMLSSVLDFKLKETHMPDESSNQTFTVKLPSSAASGTETRGDLVMCEVPCLYCIFAIDLLITCTKQTQIIH